MGGRGTLRATAREKRAEIRRRRVRSPMTPKERPACQTRHCKRRAVQTANWDSDPVLSRTLPNFSLPHKRREVPHRNLSEPRPSRFPPEKARSTPPAGPSVCPNCLRLFQLGLWAKSDEGRMKSQWNLALLAATLALVVAGAANAQGAPIYVGPGAPPPFEPPGYVRAEPLPDDVLLPREIVGILRSTGFSPLSAPIRRGRVLLCRRATSRWRGRPGDDGRDHRALRPLRTCRTDRPQHGLVSTTALCAAAAQRVCARRCRCRASPRVHRHRTSAGGPAVPGEPADRERCDHQSARSNSYRHACGQQDGKRECECKAGRSGRDQAKLQQTGRRTGVATDAADAAGTGFRIGRKTRSAPVKPGRSHFL